MQYYTIAWFHFQTISQQSPISITSNPLTSIHSGNSKLQAVNNSSRKVFPCHKYIKEDVISFIQGIHFHRSENNILGLWKPVSIADHQCFKLIYIRIFFQKIIRNYQSNPFQQHLKNDLDSGEKPEI